MTDQEKAIEQKPVDKGKNGDKPDKRAAGESKRNLITLFIILLVAFTIIACGGSYFLWSRIQEIENGLETASSRPMELAESNRKEIRQLGSGIEQLGKRQQALNETVVQLASRQPETNEDWALAEVEYLLTIAMHRLLLEHDVSTALAAMEAADRRLRDLRMPGVIPVREQIASDINKLRTVEPVDISGLAVYMADLISRADELPLSTSTPLAREHGETAPINGDSGRPAWRRFLDNAWSELKSLVVIKHEDDLSQALLLPDQEYFLYQNLRLELENARYAILRRDTANLHASIELVSEWLKDYFDTSSPAVINILDTLRQMSVLELDVELPDISSSLESLRAMIRQVKQVESGRP